MTKETNRTILISIDPFSVQLNDKITERQCKEHILHSIISRLEDIKVDVVDQKVKQEDDQIKYCAGSTSVADHLFNIIKGHQLNDEDGPTSEITSYTEHEDNIRFEINIPRRAIEKNYNYSHEFFNQFKYNINGLVEQAIADHKAGELMDIYAHHTMSLMRS